MGVSREGQREKERKKERKRWTFDKVRDRKKFKRGGGWRLLERSSVADGIRVGDFWSKRQHIACTEDHLSQGLQSGST